jgi:DMSO reductase anchor subunit
MLQTLPLMLFIVMTELSVGSVAVLVFLDWRSEVKRGFLTSYALIYLCLVGLTYLFQQNFATPELLNTYTHLDHAWTGWQSLPLLLFFLLLIPYSLFLMLDRSVGIDGKEKAQKAGEQGETVPRSGLRVLRLISGGATVLAGLVTLFVMAMIFHTLVGGALSGVATVLGFFAAAFALGGVMTAMWLGHWYLVTPALSEKPLLFSTTLVLLALVMQIGFALLAGPGSVSATQSANNTTPVVVSTATPATSATPAKVKTGNTPVVTPIGVDAIGWVRILISFIMPLILGGLSWKLVRDRSFQSATGMLYLVVVLTLAGESMARGLFLMGM